MPQNCILRTRAQIDGAIREPGYRFVLPDGVLGPHRAGRAAPERINNASGLYERIDEDRGEDVPLYDVIKDKPAPMLPTLDERIAAKHAELDQLEGKRRSVLSELDVLAVEQNKEESALDSKKAGQDAPPFATPKPPVVQTIPPLVGQKASLGAERDKDGTDSTSAQSAYAHQSAANTGATAKSGMPAPAPSKPIMAQPADAPAEKGKTERLDGSF